MVGDAGALVADRFIRQIERKNFAAGFGDGRENADVSARRAERVDLAMRVTATTPSTMKTTSRSTRAAAP
jgi:hypothetical protein